MAIWNGWDGNPLVGTYKFSLIKPAEHNINILVGVKITDTGEIRVNCTTLDPKLLHQHDDPCALPEGVEYAYKKLQDLTHLLSFYK